MYICDLWLHAGKKNMNLYQTYPNNNCTFLMDAKMCLWAQPHVKPFPHIDTHTQLTLTLMQLFGVCWSLIWLVFVSPVVSPASAAGGPGHGTRQTGDYGGVECIDRGTWTPPSASHSVYFHLLIHFFCAFLCVYSCCSIRLSMRYGLWCKSSWILKV